MALHETTIFGPVSSRNIVFARVVLVKISSNRVGTRRPSTHLWRFSTCKIFILALVFPDDDIARNFKPNTLNVRWTLTRQCDMRFLLNCSGPFTRSAVTVEGDRADRDLGSLHFFVTVHCSFPRTTVFSGLTRLSPSSCKFLSRREHKGVYTSGLFKSLLSGKDAGFQWLHAFVVFFMRHALIVTNEAAIAQLGKRLTEDPKVRSSALALYRAPAELLPISREHIVKTLPNFCRIVVEMFTWALAL